MLTPLNALLGLIAVVALLMVFIAITGVLQGTLDPGVAFGGVTTLMASLIGVLAIRIAAENRKDKDDK